MGRAAKQPNVQLSALLDEAAMSRKGLARRVVHRGSALGVRLHYDHNSVRRWLDGEQPQTPTPGLVADALAEALGRKVTPADCGFSGDRTTSEVGLEFALDWADGVRQATALWQGDVERRRFLAGASYALSVYPAASIRWLTLPGNDHPSSSSGSRRVGAPEVDAIRSMTKAFVDLDNRVGGGRVRGTVVQYLHSSVAPLLRGSYTEAVGRALFSVASDLTRLAGWMAYDEEEHGLAQRYLIQALRLARTANDHALGAEILAAMSHQAVYIGRPGDAVDLARAAQVAAKRSGYGALESECHVVEAHGHAARHDPAACARGLLAAERAYERADRDRPEWLRYFDAAYLSAKIAHCFRDLGDDQRTGHYAEQSLYMTDGYLRGRAFNLSLLGSARASTDPIEAARVGEQAADLAENMSSRRSLRYLGNLAHRLKPHQTVPAVAQFRRRVTNLAAAITAAH